MESMCSCRRPPAPERRLVLVARILEMVTSPVHPVDIDRLLVVTFTNAAAAEMRQRIRDALEVRAGAGGGQ